MTVYIYALLDPETKAVRYIGKSVEPDQRLYMHIFHATHGADTHKDRWIRQLLAADLKPIMQIIEKTTESDWPQREQYWIAFYRDQKITNITAGGVAINAPRTEIWAKRIGDAHRGKTIPQETRERISATNRAKNDAGCKHGHAWTPENTFETIKNGRPYRSCRACSRERATQKRRSEGSLTKAEYEAQRQPNLFCHAGHPLSGDNLRLLERRGKTERICRECVRIRNRAAKQRKRSK